ncbi:hypothetical protein ACWIGM_08810 [Bosea sp. NPDC055332]
MRKLIMSAALCAVMASCAASPVMAQQCASAEHFLEQIESAKPAGLVVKTYGREATAKIVEVLSAESPPPEGFKPDGIIMVSGDRAAMLLFIEDDRICHRMVLSLKAAALLEQAAFGRVV